MAHKKHTQHIFDHIKNPNRRDYYGDLGLMYEIFSALSEKRLKLKIGQHALAKKAGISQPTLAKIEAGRANPTISLLLKITRALNLRFKLEDDNNLPLNIDQD